MRTLHALEIVNCLFRMFVTVDNRQVTTESAVPATFSLFFVSPFQSCHFLIFGYFHIFSFVHRRRRRRLCRWKKICLRVFFFLSRTDGRGHGVTLGRIYLFDRKKPFAMAYRLHTLKIEQKRLCRLLLDFT